MEHDKITPAKLDGQVSAVTMHKRYSGTKQVSRYYRDARDETLFNLGDCDQMKKKKKKGSAKKKGNILDDIEQS